MSRPPVQRWLLVAATIVALAAAGCGNAPAGSGSPAPGATADADAALDAFLATVAEPGDLSFHLHQTADMENRGVPLVSAEYDLDVSGTDFSGSASAGGGGVDIAFDLVVIGESGWLRVEGEDWTEVAASDLSPEDVLDVWRYVAPREDLSVESVDADGAIHFRSTTPMAYETASMRTSGLTGQIVDAELVLRPDGTPVSLTLEIEGSGTVSGQDLELTGSTIVEFTKWGDEITITPPG